MIWIKNLGRGSGTQCQLICLNALRRYWSNSVLRSVASIQVTTMRERLKQPETANDEEESPLTISTEKVCFIIMKAKEFDAKGEVTDPDPGSNPSDDKDAAVLEDHSDDPVVEELTSLINSLSEDEQIDLVVLMWLGRDDYSSSDWP